jgi:hypothetical protein
MTIAFEHDELYYLQLFATKKDGVQRGVVDLNFAYQDGSAGTVYRVRPPPPRDDDPRMARVPSWSNSKTNKDAFRQVPRP